MADIYIRGKDGRPLLVGRTADPQLPGRVTALEDRMGRIEAAPGGVPLSDAVDSASSTTAATSKAVKTAYDKGVAAAETAKAALAAVRIPLVGNKDVYANCVTGSDTLDEGRGESPEKPFRTAQAAVNYACERHALGAYTVTVHLSEGRFDEDIVLPPTENTGGHVEIVGAGKNLTTLAGCFYTYYPAGMWYVRGMSIEYGGRNTPLSSSYLCVALSYGTAVYLYDVALSASEKTSTLIGAFYGGVVHVYGGCSFSGTCLTAFNAYNGFIGVYDPVVVDVSAVVFARAAQCGVLRIGSGASFSGTCTGKRYSAFLNGVIDTGGRGPELLPGDAEGIVESGGIYA